MIFRTIKYNITFLHSFLNNMKFSMSTLINKKHKIFNVITVFNAVDMVHYFRWQKITSQMLFHNKKEELR